MATKPTSPTTLRWMLVASILMLSFSYAGVPAGLLLAIMVVSQRPDLSK